ncbi:MAG: hypothetical protein J0H85_04420 [Sediminibacterium magnilacihabitans]|jgi:hypothetical protein|nr:hypothetical protein [Sediminibacterium magnilacihabitans]PQV61856.1 hypothetical protein CLV53_101130 [Sediminibacterium magnilacihabitans]
MKKILMSLAIAGLFGATANAQNNVSGVYLNLADFENGKLSYASNSPSGSSKIQFNEFFEKPFITVKHDGEKTQLFKDEIFAYQNKGTVVRTSNFTNYTFVEKGPVWVFYKDITIVNGKERRRERKYFYSTSGDGAILPLTINNLKKSFPDKHLFHDLLDAQFGRDSELSYYDSFEKKFKINHLLETTVL